MELKFGVQKTKCLLGEMCFKTGQRRKVMDVRD